VSSSVPSLPAFGRSDRRWARPWSREQLLLLSVGQVVGLCLVAIGTYGAGGASRPTEGMRWLTVSVLGLFCAGIANGLWLMSGRVRITQVRVMLRGAGPRSPRRRRPARIGVVRATAEVSLVTHPRSSSYHRDTCVLVTGRVSTTSASRGCHESAGLRACEVCEP
jgi:hypothetical protein